MKSLSHVFIILLSASAATAQDPDHSQDANDLLVEELRALRLEIAALTAQIDRLGEEMTRLRKDLDGRQGRSVPKLPSLGDHNTRGADLDALADIELRPNAAESEVREYVSAIVRGASANQNHWSDRDPQIDLLTRIGPANVPILMEFLGGGRFGHGDYYVHAAIACLAGEEHKELILAKLPFNHDLVKIVSRNHWVEDARPILLSVLEKRPKYLPSEWIEAVVQLQDASTYDALKTHFIEGNNRWQTFEALRGLKDLDLDDAVAQAWDRARFDHDWERDSMATIAVQFGILDALEHIATQIRAGTAEDYNLRRMQTALVQHVAHKGAVRQIAEWVIANKARLVWDAKVKEFRLP